MIYMDMKIYKEIYNHFGKWLLIWELYIDYMVVKYRKLSNIKRTLVGNKIVDYSDIVGASPVDSAPTASSFST